MSDFYQTNATAFTVGQRVAIHPATDAWMRGDRYGLVTRVDHHANDVRVLLDSARLMWFAPECLAIVPED